MPIFNHDTLGRTLFVHVPRTGGASIEQWIIDSGCDLQKVCHADPLNNQHATRKTYQQWGEFGYKFAVVRHPLTRFLSTFGFRAIQPPSVNMYAKSMLRKLRIDRMDKSWRAHLTRQVEFIGDDVEVFKFEDVTRFAKLKEKLGFKIDCPHKNHSKTSIGVEHLSNELQQQVRQLYAQDYNAFGYN